MVKKLICLLEDLKMRISTRTKMLILTLICIASIITIIIIPTSYSQSINTGLASSLIRLHVVANSDSEEDQTLKLHVRDGIIDYMKQNLNSSETVENTRNVIINKIPEVKRIGDGIIHDHGKNYDIEVELGEYPFPTKMYGDIVLPAGNYQALRVIIGKGEGRNWWCVLFPPLCFIDAVHGTVPESVKNDLKKVLTDEEYKIVTSADDASNIPINIKFKVVEILQTSKIKIRAVMGHLFKV